MSKLLLLASYPKSGNTWLRVFIANLKRGSGAPADINELDVGFTPQRMVFDEAVGVEASSLTASEIEDSKHYMYSYLASLGSGLIFTKIHEAWKPGPGESPVVSPGVAAGAVYLVRNPLDVAVSLAAHWNRTIDYTIERMASNSMEILMDRTPGKLGQRLLSWSGHVRSWLDQTDVPVHVMRYEDMCCRPMETFTAAAGFCGLPADAEQIGQAVRNSEFNVLRQQELTRGFRERPSQAPAFFRQGEAGAWKSALSPVQVERIIADHEETMRRLNYFPLGDTEPRA